MPPVATAAALAVAVGPFGLGGDYAQFLVASLAVSFIAVLSVNLLREHVALIEGDEEIILTERQTLPMRVNGMSLHLRPQSFFQTNTQIAQAMYAQGREWVAQVQPRTLWDLYCGVGGFALHAAQVMHSYCRPLRMSMPVGQTCTHMPQSMQSPRPFSAAM